MCTWYAASERGEPSGTVADLPPGNLTVTSAIITGVGVRASMTGELTDTLTNAAACASDVVSNKADNMSKLSGGPPALRRLVHGCMSL